MKWCVVSLINSCILLTDIIQQRVKRFLATWSPSVLLQMLYHEDANFAVISFLRPVNKHAPLL